MLSKRQRPQLIKIDVGDFVHVPMGEYGGSNSRRCNLHYDDGTTKYRELTPNQIKSLESKITKF